MRWYYHQQERGGELKSANPEHMKSNAEIDFKISDEDMAELKKFTPVDYGKAGYLCENNSVDEIVNHMLNIINDKEQYEQMRKKAYDFSTQFNWKDSSKLFRNLVYKCVDNMKKKS